jgi:hypothetical protein
MRIISDFHDYYDSAQSMGQDQSLVYLRKREEIESFYQFPSMSNVRCWSRKLSKLKLDISSWTVGFCGRIYPVIQLERFRYSTNKLSVFCYNFNEVNQFIENQFDKDVISSYQGKAKTNITKDLWPRNMRNSDFVKYFQWFKDHASSFSKRFLEKRSPIFLVECDGGIEKQELVWNARLADVEFFKIMDTYTAFQEIAMYYGGLASPEKPIPEVPDKTMVTAKGFDEKWSFRKEPNKK